MLVSGRVAFSVSPYLPGKLFLVGMGVTLRLQNFTPCKKRQTFTVVRLKKNTLWLLDAPPTWYLHMVQTPHPTTSMECPWHPNPRGSESASQRNKALKRPSTILVAWHHSLMVRWFGMIPNHQLNYAYEINQYRYMLVGGFNPFEKY